APTPVGVVEFLVFELEIDLRCGGGQLLVGQALNPRCDHPPPAVKLSEAGYGGVSRLRYVLVSDAAPTCCRVAGMRLYRDFTARQSQIPLPAVGEHAQATREVLRIKFEEDHLVGELAQDQQGNRGGEVALASDRNSHARQNRVRVARRDAQGVSHDQFLTKRGQGVYPMFCGQPSERRFKAYGMLDFLGGDFRDLARRLNLAGQSANLLLANRLVLPDDFRHADLDQLNSEMARDGRLIHAQRRDPGIAVTDHADFRLPQCAHRAGGRGMQGDLGVNTRVLQCAADERKGDMVLAEDIRDGGYAGDGRVSHDPGKIEVGRESRLRHGIQQQQRQPEPLHEVKYYGIQSVVQRPYEEQIASGGSYLVS